MELKKPEKKEISKTKKIPICGEIHLSYSDMVDALSFNKSCDLWEPYYNQEIKKLTLILEDPERWILFCNEKMLDRCEKLERKVWDIKARELTRDELINIIYALPEKSEAWDIADALIAAIDKKAGEKGR